MQGSPTRTCLGGANLQEAGQNRRLRAAAVLLAVTLGGAVAMVHADVARSWRLLLFLPFFFFSQAAHSSR